MISAQCFTQCLVATLDVSSALQFFATRAKESTTCASFCVNAWPRSRQATDRDLESSSTRRKANSWTRARLATDRDLESKRCEKVNAWICAL